MNTKKEILGSSVILLSNLRISFLSLLLALAMNVAAETSPNGKTYSVLHNGLYYNLISKNSTSYYELVDADYIENLVVPDEIDGIQVQSVNLQNRVDIESATFGANITFIDMYGCQYLTTIDIAKCDNLKCYFQKTGIVELLVPVNAEAHIANCEGLEKVTFLGDIKSCDFSKDISLRSIIMHNDMTVMPHFNGCTSLASIDIPKGVKEIGGFTFADCSSLSQINIPVDSELEILGNNCFSGTNITYFECPVGLKVIDGAAFANTSITEFKFSEGLDIKRCATPDAILNGSGQLRKLVYPNMDMMLSLPPSFRLNGMGKCLENNNHNRVEIYVGGNLLTELTIPSTKNYENAFAYTSGLKSVKIANCTSTPNFKRCFAYIPTLETVEIGAGAPSLMETFKCCPNLKTVIVSSKNKTIDLDGTFTECSSLSKCEFPSVKNLSGYNFMNCTSLESVDFPQLTTISDFYCFENCISLKMIDFPLVSSLGTATFKGCTSLESVNLPMINVIPSETFKDCASLVNFDFGKIAKIGNEAFYNTGFTEITLPSDTYFYDSFNACKNLKYFNGTCLDDARFDNLPKLEKLNLTIADENIRVSVSSSMTDCYGDIIVNGTFRELNLGQLLQLNRLEINGTITESFDTWSQPKIFAIDKIENYLNWTCFRDRTPGNKATSAEIDLYIGGEKVTNLCIPAGTTIKNRFFRGMTIEKITFMEGNEPTVVNNNVFENCSNLCEVDFRGNVTYLGEGAFAGTGFETFIMPATVTSMGTGCFDLCGKLKHVTFSPSLKEIPSGTFFNCPSLQNIIIPEGVESMGYMVSVFTYNKKLKLISLPSTFKKFSQSLYTSFQEMPSDVEFFSWAKTPPSGAKDRFINNTVHVPVGSKDAYSVTSVWTGCNIIDDLLLDNTVEVADNNVTINVPVNGSVTANGKVTRYVVECYMADETENSEPVAVYEFDGDGIMVPSTRGVVTSVSLNIPNLEKETTYRFAIKGYTDASDLVYSTTEVAKTSIGTNIDDIRQSPDDIRLLGKTLIVPAIYGSQLLRIYDVNGKEVMSREIGEQGEAIILSLNPGIYVMKIRNITLKFRQ